MDAFKRTTLLMAQAAMAQITSDQVRIEANELIPQMLADPESQPTKAESEQDQPPQGYKPSGY